VADVVGVVFPNGTKTYYFDPAGLQLSRGDKVVVQTANGPEIGQVVEPPHTIDDAELPAPLKKVTRVATGKDLELQAASANVRREALAVCRQLIAAHGLDMKLVGAEVSFGGDKITFSFTAEERVDFRGLVADLAKTLKTRIELRQVGAREEARLVGGLGPCGRRLCCTLFPPSEEPVSIRMAKEQNLPLNPTKISGLCGRLMCCLKYEQEQYVQFRKEAPAKGTPVSTPTGEGVVAGYDFMKESILVKLEDGTTTLVRLDTCQLKEDGGLVVVPVEPEPLTLATDLTAALEAVESLSEVEAAPEELAVVEAERGAWCQWRAGRSDRRRDGEARSVAARARAAGAAAPAPAGRPAKARQRRRARRISSAGEAGCRWRACPDAERAKEGRQGRGGRKHHGEHGGRRRRSQSGGASRGTPPPPLVSRRPFLRPASPRGRRRCNRTGAQGPAMQDARELAPKDSKREQGGSSADGGDGRRGAQWAWRVAGAGPGAASGSEGPGKPHGHSLDPTGGAVTAARAVTGARAAREALS
jgi:cell fate regulator YaaT (PSP1 superfamily)